MQTLALLLNELASSPEHGPLARRVAGGLGFVVPVTSGAELDALWAQTAMLHVWRVAREHDFPSPDALLQSRGDHAFQQKVSAGALAMLVRAAKEQQAALGSAISTFSWQIGALPVPFEAIQFEGDGGEAQQQLHSLYSELAR